MVSGVKKINGKTYEVFLIRYCRVIQATHYPTVSPNYKGLSCVYLLHSGGPDGELGASIRYLSQRFSMPDDVTKGILNDIGRSVGEMLREGEIGAKNTADKPFPGFLIHRITTRDRIKKYDGISDKPVVEEGKTERVIRLFAV